MRDQQLESWIAAIEARVGANLTFQEIRRGLQALSALYVEKRERITAKALDGAGKRAAFAVFYGPLHLLLVERIVEELGAAGALARIVDLGCGTGVGAAAWALSCPEPRPELYGADVHDWAAREAEWSWSTLGLRGRAEVKRLEKVKLPGAGSGVVAAFTVNELDEGTRVRLRDDLVACGARVLIVEPIAKRALGWWDDWQRAFEAAGGRASEHRFRVQLPARLRLYDKAAGLDHQELKGRSLYLPGR